jgi:hypothetical protein
MTRSNYGPEQQVIHGEVVWSLRTWSKPVEVQEPQNCEVHSMAMRILTIFAGGGACTNSRCIEYGHGFRLV